MAGLVLAFVALVGGIVATTMQARRARDAELAARQSEQAAVDQAATVQESNRFLQALIGFDGADPAGVVRSGDTTMREMMADADGLLTRDPFTDPEAEATLRIAIGNAQRRFGLREQAVITLERALEMRIETHGEYALGVAETLNTLGVARYSTGDSEGAVEDWRHALVIYRELGSPEPAKEATTRGNLASVLAGLGKFDEAEAMLLDAIEVHERELGAQSLHVAGDFHQLAKLRLAQGRSEEAIDYLQRSLEIGDAIDQPDHPQPVIHATTLFTVLQDLRRYEDAEPVARDLVERIGRVHGEGSVQWGDAHNNLALVLLDLGLQSEARERIAVAVETYRLAGATRPLVFALSLQTRILLEDSDPQAAVEPAREAVELYPQVLGPSHVDCITSKVFLAQALVQLGQDDEAEPLLRDALDRLPARTEPAGKQGLGAAVRGATELAMLLLRRGVPDPGVEELHQRALRLLDGLNAETSQRLRILVLDNYAFYLLSIKDADRLVEAERMLLLALDLSLDVYGEDASETATIRGLLARTVVAREEDEPR